jgi:hypothetical protein
MPIDNPTLTMLMRGVNTTESSNNYKAIGPRTRTGDRAYGISQVMGANVPDWTKQFYGQSLTPEQYLNTPEAQVAVTQGKLGELLQKYKTPQDAASVWFSGRPLDKSANASDGFLKTPEYIQRVMQAGGMPGSFNDARSFQATGTDEMANAASQPQGAQSISLGDQENSQPFNNIGSTLANMGAAIASLDNRGTGIASLNASRVAGNLAAQEQAREAQGGWKYAGQTQNGQGLMFQNSRGEIRVEPLSSQFAGKSNSDLPSSVREFQYRQENKDYADYMDNKDKLEPSLSQDTRRMYAMRSIKGDNTWTREIGGDKQGAVDKRAIDEEQTKVAKELGLDVSDIMKSRTELRYRNKVADRIAQIDVNTETAANKIDAAATNLIETSKQYPRGDVRFIEGLKQKWDEQTNDPKLQALKTAVDAFSLDYATALNPQKTSPTVDDVRNARNKILTTMNQESLEAAVNIVQREVGSIRQNARKTHEQWFGSSEEAPTSGNKKTIRDSDSPQTKRLKYNPQTGELE